MNINHLLFSHLRRSDSITISIESLRRILVAEKLDTTTIVNILDKVKAERITAKTIRDHDITFDTGSLAPGIEVTLDNGRGIVDFTIDQGIGSPYQCSDFGDNKTSGTLDPGNGIVDKNLNTNSNKNSGTLDTGLGAIRRQHDMGDD